MMLSSPILGSCCCTTFAPAEMLMLVHKPHGNVVINTFPLLVPGQRHTELGFLWWGPVLKSIQQTKLQGCVLMCLCISTVFLTCNDNALPNPKTCLMMMESKKEKML